MEHKNKSLVWKRLTGQWIVDKKNQWSLIIYIFVITIFSSLGFQMTVTMAQTLAAGDNSGSSVMIISSVVGYLILFLSILLAFAISNYFVGPIYRIRMHMKQIQESGELKPVQIRKGDHFQNLADDFNEFLQFVEKKSQTGKK